jgi:hypothetical protein
MRYNKQRQYKPLSQTSICHHHCHVTALAPGARAFAMSLLRFSGAYVGIIVVIFKRPPNEESE